MRPKRAALIAVLLFPLAVVLLPLVIWLVTFIGG